MLAVNTMTAMLWSPWMYSWTTPDRIVSDLMVGNSDVRIMIMKFAGRYSAAAAIR